jgi:hypothetical protein
MKFPIRLAFLILSIFAFGYSSDGKVHAIVNSQVIPKDIVIDQVEFPLEYFIKKYGKVYDLQKEWCPNDSLGVYVFSFKTYNTVVKDSMMVGVHFLSNGKFANYTSHSRLKSELEFRDSLIAHAFDPEWQFDCPRTLK